MFHVLCVFMWVGDAEQLNALRVPFAVGKEVAIVCKKCHKQAVPVAMFL